MNTAAKTLRAMRRNPLDWGMPDLLKVARQLGMSVRSSGGSHHVFSHPASASTVTVPARRPIKPVYVKLFLALADDIGSSNEE